MSEDMYFRPPSEADSFIVRVMHGCPHNECTFCNLFKDVPCRVIPLKEVLAGMEQDAKDIGPQHLHLLTSMYLEGGDPMALKTSHLLAIIEHAKALFPQLTRFASYATAKFTVRKSQEELNALSAAGLRRVFVGLESGSARILERTHKGCTPEDLEKSAIRLKRAGIEMDVSIMIGIGGQEDSDEHALGTAALLNKTSPECVRIRTFVAKEGTELGQECLDGNFTLLTPHDALRELRLMVENIDSKMQLLSEHWSDFIHFIADMPEDKRKLLEFIRLNLEVPEQHFRPVGISAEKS